MRPTLVIQLLMCSVAWCPQQSTKRLSSRSLYLVLRKKEPKAEFWPRLTKEKVKTPFVKTDFSKWVDEDEQDGEEIKAEEEPDLSGALICIHISTTRH